MSEAARNLEGNDPKEQRETLEAMGYKCIVMANTNDEEGRRIFDDAVAHAQKKKRTFETVEDGSIKEVWVKNK